MLERPSALSSRQAHLPDAFGGLFMSFISGRQLSLGVGLRGLLFCLQQQTSLQFQQPANALTL